MLCNSKALYVLPPMLKSVLALQVQKATASAKVSLDKPMRACQKRARSAQLQPMDLLYTGQGEGRSKSDVGKEVKAYSGCFDLGCTPS